MRQVLAALLLCFTCAVSAAEIEVKNTALTLGEEGWLLSADFSIELNARLEDVVSRGVPLYFAAEFALRRPRWYWVDEDVAIQTRSYRLSYHALTRQYRLSSGSLHQNFNTLDEALRILSRLRDWHVAEKNQLKAGEPYLAALRLRLDLTQLPKPLQVTAIGSKEWNLVSDWRRWNHIVGAP